MGEVVFETQTWESKPQTWDVSRAETKKSAGGRIKNRRIFLTLFFLAHF